MENLPWFTKADILAFNIALLGLMIFGIAYLINKYIKHK